MLDAFEEAVAPYLQLMRNNLFDNSVLATIRDRLLPKLISREISVPSVERVTDG